MKKKLCLITVSCGLLIGFIGIVNATSSSGTGLTDGQHHVYAEYYEGDGVRVKGDSIRVDGDSVHVEGNSIHVDNYPTVQKYSPEQYCQIVLSAYQTCSIDAALQARVKEICAKYAGQLQNGTQMADVIDQGVSTQNTATPEQGKCLMQQAFSTDGN